MLLTVDVGNTNITYGIFEGEKMRTTWRMATDIHQMPDQYAALLLTLLQHEGLQASDITEASVCSVVPPLLGTFDELFQKFFHIQPFMVGPGVKTGVRIRMDNPKEVGADRIVNAIAAYQIYGGPLIVVDFGTATTFDAISKEGEYLGGAIAPGIGISTEALYTRAAKLPRIELAKPKTVIGKNTVSSMQSGIIYGFVEQTDGIITRMKKEMGGSAVVVATGGFAELISSDSRNIDRVNHNLTLEGLRIIYERNKTDAEA